MIIKNNFVHNYFIGAHLSIKGSYLNIFKEAADLNIKVIGCFTAPNLRYDMRTELDNDIVKNFRIYLNNYTVFSHAGYLINIADKNKEKNYNLSCMALEAEIIRCQQLGVQGIAFHPGSNQNEAEGLDTIASSINQYADLLSQGKTKLLIEPSSHQGSTLPWSLEHIRYLLRKIDKNLKEKIGIVLDTCHIFASGYDISSKGNVQQYLNEYNALIGLETVQLIHFNDSKFSCGSKRDRHETIGRGAIGFEGLLSFITHPDMKQVPKILETPVDTYRDWIPELESIDMQLAHYV